MGVDPGEWIQRWSSHNAICIFYCELTLLRSVAKLQNSTVQDFWDNGQGEVTV